MKKHLLTIAFGTLAVIAGCASNSGDDELGGSDPNSKELSKDPEATAGGEDNTQNHMNGNEDPNSNVEAKKSDDLLNGGADRVSRMHGCEKISYDALGKILAARGVNITGGTAGNMYRNGTPSLGVANYRSRIREAAFPSTASHAKQFDIFVAAATDIIANLKTSTACPGLSVLGADGKFSKDAISCIIGAPAGDDFKVIADQALADNPTDGAKIAVASLLTSTYACR